MTYDFTADGVGLADAVSRTDLLLGRRGTISALRDADVWFEQRPVHLTVDVEITETAQGQSAMITLVTLLRRAGFPVRLDRACDGEVLVGPYRGQPIHEVLARFGVSWVDPSDASGSTEVVDDMAQLPAGAREVLIGDVAPRLPQAMHLTWDGWVAAVRRPGDRLAERPGCVLAPLLAAALVVSEIMESHLGVLDAGWREVTLSLWDPIAPDPIAAQGPALRWLPQSWMLIGLGHLGQANAWCLSYLPYPDGMGELWLADDERVAQANLSTGILTEPAAMKADHGRPARKTRIVATAVEQAGRQTRLLETRVHPSMRFHDRLPPIALVGVDNLDLRRALSDLDWPVAIDAGLGSTPSSFDSLAVRVFDNSGPSSHDVAAWAALPPLATAANDPIFEDLRLSGLDECGLVTLASKKVACAYVGMTAACLSIAEGLRRTLAGPAMDSLTTVLDAHLTRGQHTTPRELRVPLVDGDAQ